MKETNHLEIEKTTVTIEILDDGEINVKCEGIHDIYLLGVIEHLRVLIHKRRSDNEEKKQIENLIKEELDSKCREMEENILRRIKNKS